MTTQLHRAFDQPNRDGLSREELWREADRGLIWCWECGRQKRIKEPELAVRAERGELLVLAWKGGIEKKLKIERKPGTLQYLATWQGLRGEDLNIALEDETAIVCSVTGQTVVFSAKVIPDEELIAPADA